MFRDHDFQNKFLRENSLIHFVEISFFHRDYLIFRSPSKKIAHAITTAAVTDDKGKLTIPPGRSSRSYDNKVQSLGAREPRQAWGEGNQSDELVYTIITIT